MTIDVKLLRIDSRLLHGQVATNWAKTIKVDRILVVSDRVADDKIRKTLILQAKPPGIKVHVITLDKMLRIYRDARFYGMRVLILVEDPLDALTLIKGGIKVASVNVGAISFDNTKKMVSDAISVNQADVEAFKWMHQHKIKLDMRKVSNDSSKDFWKVLIEKGLVSEN